MIHALERLGSVLFGEIGDLWKYRAKIIDNANQSSLASDIPAKHQDWHTTAECLYDNVRHGRNDAFHQGAYARHLTTHVIELAIVLEDALTQSADAKSIRDFMVRGPVCASLWQPLSFVRQQMLVGSFSYLPLWKDEGWHLISDSEVARYLSFAPSKTQHSKRLAQTVSEAITDGLMTKRADILRATDFTDKFFELPSDAPALVCRQDEEDDIIGIITAYDLL